MFETLFRGRLVSKKPFKYKEDREGLEFELVSGTDKYESSLILRAFSDHHKTLINSAKVGDILFGLATPKTRRKNEFHNTETTVNCIDIIRSRSAPNHQPQRPDQVRQEQAQDDQIPF